MGMIGTILLIGGATGAFAVKETGKEWFAIVAFVGVCILIWAMATTVGESALGGGEIKWGY